ncbi:MAG: substrate-binding domain-containing protein, partial [Paracoccaceae bacterium]|nr:substrate-binding domain-containing protein [Paracoccaceae bacterium]
PDRPTAVLCGNDILAWGVINCARSLDLDVPSSLSVLGIGHFKAFQDMEPSLTTVRLPAQRIGSMAGTTISMAITQPDEEITHSFCPSELVVGKTLKPLVG